MQIEETTSVKSPWTILLISSATLLGCGSTAAPNFPEVSPTALLITPKNASQPLGQTQQFVATANFANGTTLDVTSQVQWSSSNPTTALVVSNSGLATALLPGQVTITARSGNLSDTAILTVTGGTTRVSLDSAGTQATGGSSGQPSISEDGRFVAFTSFATNLVAADTNGFFDTFVHDRQTRSTLRVSLDSAGNQANDGCIQPSISDDGRFVAFASRASNLVTGDTNGATDVFVHDRQSGATTRVSVSSTGVQGNDFSDSPSISRDGRFVAFTSNSSNLVADDTSGDFDVFVHDRLTATTTRVSVDSSGGQANRFSLNPSISGDGRFVAFLSFASNLVAGDSNGSADVFVHDRIDGTTTRTNLDSSGVEANGQSFQPTLSGDGRFVAFRSGASNLVASDTNGVDDIFVHDRQTGATTRVSLSSSGAEGDQSSSDPKLSGDGRFVTFTSGASNLVAGDSNGVADIFLRDRLNGTTLRVNLSATGLQANAESYEPAISADGLLVAFTSVASNLVAGDSNGLEDIFVTNR